MEKIKLEYQHEDTTLEAYVAYKDDGCRKPCVMVAHAWGGRDDFVCNKVEQLASMGFVGFALDMYGKGVLGQSSEENSRLMGPFIEDRELLRDRILVSYEKAQSIPVVHNHKMAIMGYCFGGLVALDLARNSPPDLKGVISFHGLLHKPQYIANDNKITSKVLVLHGYTDPMVKVSEVNSFCEEMELGGCDWQIHQYGRVKHAFTNPEAQDHKMGTVFNHVAEKRSWNNLMYFFSEIF